MSALGMSAKEYSPLPTFKEGIPMDFSTVDIKLNLLEQEGRGAEIFLWERSNMLNCFNKHN
jgi:hypothetical protein